MTREERNEFNYIRKTVRSFPLTYGTLLSIRLDTPNTRKPSTGFTRSSASTPRRSRATAGGSTAKSG